MKRKRTNRPYIPRREFKFWLRTDREGDTRLMEFIQYCKSTRQFARKVRDGLRLIWSLSEGNTSVLFELFPHLEEILKPPPAPSAPDSGDLKQQIEIAVQAGVQKALITKFSEAIELPAPPVGYPLMKESRGTVGAGATFSAPPGDDEDDGDTVVIKQVEKPMHTMVENLMKMMDSDTLLTGKNHTAEANKRSLEGRRLS